MLSTSSNVPRSHVLASPTQTSSAAPDNGIWKQKEERCTNMSSKCSHFWFWHAHLDIAFTHGNVCSMHIEVKLCSVPVLTWLISEQYHNNVKILKLWYQCEITWIVNAITKTRNEDGSVTEQTSFSSLHKQLSKTMAMAVLSDLEIVWLRQT